MRIMCSNVTLTSATVNRMLNQNIHITLASKYEGNSDRQNSNWHTWCFFYYYRQTSIISRTKSQNLNVSNLVMHLPSPNPLKPGVASRM